MMSILARVVFSNTLRSPKNPFLFSRFCPKGGQRRPKSRVNSYVLTKYVGLMKTFENNLKKYFPKGAKFYEVFTLGLKYLKSDCIILFKAFKKVTSEGWSSLSRKELEIYYQLPKDMLRAAPVLIIGAGVPLGGLVFLLAYNFPRQLLTYHFWSVQQKNEFALLSHKKRLGHYKPLFRLMENNFYKSEAKAPHCDMNEILESLKNGKQPGIDLILSCKELFEKPPYGLKYLSRPHVVGLLNIYDMHRGWGRIKRLENRALLLKLMDTAIVKEGGLEQLTQDEIIWNCFVRGLNPIDMKQEDILKWMTNWLAISQQVDERSYSLLLHCPILLGYSEPSNWLLLHDKRKFC